MYVLLIFFFFMAADTGALFQFFEQKNIVFETLDDDKGSPNWSDYFAAPPAEYEGKVL